MIDLGIDVCNTRVLLLLAVRDIHKPRNDGSLGIPVVSTRNLSETWSALVIVEKEKKRTVEIFLCLRSGCGLASVVGQRVLISIGPTRR